MTKERYERGSLLQKVFDPLANAPRLANGAVFYKVEDRELVGIDNEEKLRAEYERMKLANSTTTEISEDEADELRIALVDELDEVALLGVGEFVSGVAGHSQDL